jgi:hypothetical protein
LAYYFTANILADCPNVTARDALKISMRITRGYKGEIFVFILSWIGWFLLSGLTLGILYVVYVGPYWYTADAGLYIELRNRALADGIITPEELGMDEAADDAYPGDAYADDALSSDADQSDAYPSDADQEVSEDFQD